MKRKATHKKIENYLAVLLLLSFVLLIWRVFPCVNSAQTGTLQYMSSHKDIGLRGNTAFFLIERTRITSTEIRDTQRHILRKTIQRIPFFKRYFNTSIRKEQGFYAPNFALVLLTSFNLTYPEEDEEPPSTKA